MYEIFEKLLMEKGLRPSDVSKATGIRTGVLSDWKRGRYQPKADKIKAIAEYLEVSPEYLTTGKNRSITLIPNPHRWRRRYSKAKTSVPSCVTPRLFSVLIIHHFQQ